MQAFTCKSQWVSWKVQSYCGNNSKGSNVFGKKNQLIKVRGGAIANKDLKEVYLPSVIEKTTVRQLERKRIGNAEVSLIKENETIIIDSGSTTLEVVKNIYAFKNLTIITNALNIVIELCEYVSLIL